MRTLPNRPSRAFVLFVTLVFVVVLHITSQKPHVEAEDNYGKPLGRQASTLSTQRLRGSFPSMLCRMRALEVCPRVCHKTVGEKIQRTGRANPININRTPRWVCRSDVDGEEDEPMDIDATLDIPDEEGAWDEPDVTDTVAEVVEEVGEEDVSNDDEWYRTLSTTFVVDKEATTGSIQGTKDPDTDKFVAAAAEKDDAPGQDSKLQTDEIDNVLADITKEIKELKTELTESGDLDAVDFEDKDEDWFRNWPDDPTMQGHAYLTPPRKGDLEDESEVYIMNDNALPDW
eukprot:CAMPEP_0114510458 /NCGR_PEP_ID=MMETSP0109-20121206/13804_1 /TAXON_ID=29199 /ORGANISM="Chlorarachnion reptans, Strain CCCM449" /LENGTH=286 /DNA_ID=CAMNT_0001689779 /DNA_START=196 /DNA_END=1053 /DNA_ORIENTATION=+